MLGKIRCSKRMKKQDFLKLSNNVRYDGVLDDRSDNVFLCHCSVLIESFVLR